MKEPKRLNARQLRFVDEYMVDMNAAAAARRAGYAERSAKQRAAELMSWPSIQDAITAARRALSERTGVDQDRVIRELSRIAFGDARRVMAWGPGGVVMIDSQTLNDEAAAIVSEASQKETQFGRHITVKTHDKVKALELIGRHLGMFTDNVNNRFPDGTPPVQVYLPDNSR